MDLNGEGVSLISGWWLSLVVVELGLWILVGIWGELDLGMVVEFDLGVVAELTG